MTDVLSQLALALASGEVRIVDLTQTLSAQTPVIELPPPFAQSPPFSMKQISRYDAAGPSWYWNELHLGEHTGTHFDAPAHWITGRDLPRNACDTLDVANLVGPACVIDITAQTAANEDYLLTPQDITSWESTHGRIAAGAWLLLRTDWSKRTGTDSFLNVRADGPHSPGFTKDAVELLARDRDVLGVGVETVGTDAGQAGGFDPPFPAHHVMLGAGKFGLASLCNLDQLPPTGAIVIAAPLKIKNGSGSPMRTLAFVTSEPAS